MPEHAPASAADLPVELVPFDRGISVDAAEVPATVGALAAALLANARLTATLNAASGIRTRTFIPTPSWVLRLDSGAARIVRERDITIGDPFLVFALDHTDDLLVYTGSWELRLRGVRAPILIGSAPATDDARVAELITAAADPDALMTFAALSAPDALAQIASRRSAASARTAGDIPAMTSAKVRQILLAAGLSRPDDAALNGGYGGAYVRPLSVRNAAKPIALAIRVEVTGVSSRPLTAAEKALPTSQRWQVISTLQAEYAQEWLPRAKAALEAAGWRVVFDVPEAERTYHEKHSAGFYVTRASDDILARFADLATDGRRALTGRLGKPF